jgi:hypothetical protein
MQVLGRFHPGFINRNQIRILECQNGGLKNIYLAFLSIKVKFLFIVYCFLVIKKTGSGMNLEPGATVGRRDFGHETIKNCLCFHDQN